MQHKQYRSGQPRRLRPTRLVRYTERLSWETQKKNSGEQIALASTTPVKTRRIEEKNSGEDVAILPLALLEPSADQERHSGKDVALRPSRLPEQAEPEDDDIAMQTTIALKAMVTPRPHPSLMQPPVTPPVHDFPDLDDLDEQLPDDALDVSLLPTAHLMRLSGMMRAVRPSQPLTAGRNAGNGAEEWWPDGIRQTGALPVVNLYGNEPFGRTRPLAGVTAATPSAKPQPGWKRLLSLPSVRIALGLIIGIALLFLVSKVVDVSTTVAMIKENLTTPRGIAFALLSGVAFLLAFSIRGVRWKLFLNPIGKISTLKAIQLFLIGIFLNFLLPIRGGEVAKSLMLKRIASIPVSQSLPTVAMDKALDLMPALFIMALVPLFGVHMDIKLWLVLGAVGGLLICLICFVALAAWKRVAAIGLLQKMTALLPRSLGSKIEGFATGFVDSLLAGASQPKIFIPAVLLTVVAVTFDGLFAMLAFWTVGVPISFGTAIFGYTVYNMFYILPTPPGQVGSNEAIGLLVFYGLLHLNARGVTAMFFFSHPWAALLMCVSGMGSLSALGLTVSSALKVQVGSEDAAASDRPTDEKYIKESEASIEDSLQYPQSRSLKTPS
jgi:uncharacterized protein (TIRG00374 family)